MMWLNNYQWHFDYVRLAKDSGFNFEKTKCPLDKNKICMIDLDKLIAERDVGTIEQFLPIIVQYSIETCEHLGIIDQNFLKLFRISQLAVEYLLFCKKYLDRTVTLLKGEMKAIQSENKELQEFNNELKQHTDTLLEKLNIRDSTHCYKCAKCPKAFSTEEYLAAHIERRHSIKEQTPIIGVDLEMEIKEIKQKLNNTEKLMKNEELNPKLEDTLNKNYSKVSELLLKFESLKTQLENDFKILQTQKDFEEKYSKIFQTALDNVRHQVNNEINSSPSRFCEKRNSVTQTDFHVEKTTQVEQDEEKSSKEEFEKLPNLEEQMKKVSENITHTVDSSLKNVETQLQALWEKLQELETRKTPIDTPKELIVEAVIEPPKPKIRQRLKTTIKNQPIVDDETHEEGVSKNSSEIKYDDLDRIDIMEDVPLELPKGLKMDRSASLMYGTDETESENEENSLKGEIVPEILPKEKPKREASKPNLSVVKKQSAQTLVSKSSKSSEMKPIIDSFEDIEAQSRKKIEGLLSKKFSDLGLSIDWKGIPNQTYTRTMDIIKHQVNLMKKKNPNFEETRKKMLKEVDKEAAKIISKKPISYKTKTRKLKDVPSLQNLKSPNKLSVKKVQSATVVEIKNRKMFESDSSGDENATVFKRIPSNIIKRTEPYSAVIDELKKTQQSDENIEPNLGKPVLVKSLTESEKFDVKNAKGVLKNFPSSAPVAKKRVLFNLKTDSSQHMLKDIGEGSSTSAASSVLDLSGDNVKKRIEDLSDSDFSFIDELGAKKVN